MNADNKEDTTSRCASCGAAEIDDVKLKDCDGCDLVRYCSVNCQELHRKQHKEACKRRAAALREELLFKQPESSHMGDCPLCCLPLPLDNQKSSICHSCSKIFCDGCCCANMMREMEMRLQHACPFCRESAPENDEEGDKRRMKRIEANDPVAIRQEGIKQYTKGYYVAAFEYFRKAARLGDAQSHYHLADLYRMVEGGEKDEGKGMYHLEEAAIGGHPDARYLLGCLEESNSNIERAVKHWIISATQGHDKSIKTLMEGFKNGFVSKEDLAATLRAHQAAIDATKSPQREAADKNY